MSWFKWSKRDFKKIYIEQDKESDIFMKSRKVQIKNKAGLHARPSSLFVQLVTGYDSDITVKCDEEEINGKSIMGLMLLAAEQGRTLELIADGPDEDEMLDALVNLIEVKKFNEE